VASPDKAGAQEEQRAGFWIGLGWVRETLMRDDRDTWGTRSREKVRVSAASGATRTAPRPVDEGASVHHGGASLSDSSDQRHRQGFKAATQSDRCEVQCPAPGEWS